ncbi:hypothetical protein L596_022630 [Steinernema carpocapsae]|uniref:Uncharacterized protein n=1 Tax=Steinernema carpocapsae TaxID=34508 RepID=A0A4U5MM77_STECR|nr:hypothetical protein L596_022630 [Steinernema carpocapsae]
MSPKTSVPPTQAPAAQATNQALGQAQPSQGPSTSRPASSPFRQGAAQQPAATQASGSNSFAPVEQNPMEAFANMMKTALERCQGAQATQHQPASCPRSTAPQAAAPASTSVPTAAPAPQFDMASVLSSLMGQFQHGQPAQAAQAQSQQTVPPLHAQHSHAFFQSQPAAPTPQAEPNIVSLLTTLLAAVEQPQHAQAVPQTTQATRFEAQAPRQCHVLQAQEPSSQRCPVFNSENSASSRCPIMPGSTFGRQCPFFQNHDNCPYLAVFGGECPFRYFAGNCPAFNQGSTSGRCPVLPSGNRCPMFNCKSSGYGCPAFSSFGSGHYTGSCCRVMPSRSRYPIFNQSFSKFFENNDQCPNLTMFGGKCPFRPFSESCPAFNHGSLGGRCPVMPSESRCPMFNSGSSGQGCPMFRSTSSCCPYFPSGSTCPYLAGCPVFNCGCPYLERYQPVASGNYPRNHQTRSYRRRTLGVSRPNSSVFKMFENIGSQIIESLAMVALAALMQATKTDAKENQENEKKSEYAWGPEEEAQGGQESETQKAQEDKKSSNTSEASVLGSSHSLDSDDQIEHLSQDPELD